MYTKVQILVFKLVDDLGSPPLRSAKDAPGKKEKN